MDSKCGGQTVGFKAKMSSYESWIGCANLGQLPKCDSILKGLIHSTVVHKDPPCPSFLIGSELDTPVAPLLG